MNPKQTPRLSRKTAVIVLLAYSLLSVLMTWPMAAQLNTHLFGRGSDAWSHFWVFWWVKDGLLNGHTPYFTELLYHPSGIPLYTQNIAWINIAIWLGLQLFVTELAAYNITFMAVYALNAFSMFLLIYVLLRQRPLSQRPFALDSLPFAAFLGGLIYGFWPYILRHSFHPNLSLTASIPLAMLALYRLIRYKRWRDASIAGLLIGLIGITRWQLLVMALFIIIPFVLYHLYQERQTVGWALMGKLAAANGIALLLMLPLLIPVANYQMNRPFPEDIFLDEQEGAQTDLAAYLLPSHTHPLWGDAVKPAYEGMPESFNYTPFIGFMTLFLAVLGTAKGWRFSRFHLFLAGLLLLLALGPVLQINGTLFPTVPMPYTLISSFSLVRLLRKTDRLNVLLGIPLSTLAAAGGMVLLANKQRWQRWAIFFALSVLILFEYTMFPFPTQDARVPIWYTEVLAKAGEETAVIELPLQPRGADKQHMYYQTAHRHPIAGGHISRIPREAYRFINSSDLLRSLEETGIVGAEITAVSDELHQLADAGFVYLLLDKREIDGAYQDSVQAWITIEPVYEDEDIIVYSTQPKAGKDFVITQMLTADIGLIRAAFTPQSLPQAGTIHIDARWGGTTAVSQQLQSCYALVDENKVVVQENCTPFSISQWEKDTVINSDTALPISPYLLAGKYELRSSLQTAVGESIGGSASLGFVNIAAKSRLFDAPLPETVLNAHWPVGVNLLGYEKAVTGDEVRLTLYWQAGKRPSTDLVLFVHLIDEAGNIAAQYDAMPLANSYPLTWWETGEWVTDKIALSLATLPSGCYHLIAGWYDGSTGERMVVQTEHDKTVDGAILLGEVSIEE